MLYQKRLLIKLILCEMALGNAGERWSERDGLRRKQC